MHWIFAFNAILCGVALNQSAFLENNTYKKNGMYLNYFVAFLRTKKLANNLRLWYALSRLSIALKQSSSELWCSCEFSKKQLRGNSIFYLFHPNEMHGSCTFSWVRWLNRTWAEWKNQSVAQTFRQQEINYHFHKMELSTRLGEHKKGANLMLNTL